MANTNNTEVTEDLVAAYLREHPDFFKRQTDLLSELSLPHSSGEAISLVERQVSLLRERNMDMRHRLSSLLDNARENDRLFDKTKRIVLSILEGGTLEDTLNTVFSSFRDDFDIHYTSIILYGEAEDFSNTSARVVTKQDARNNIGKIIRQNNALSGTFSTEETTYIFGDNAQHIGSVAMVPLGYGHNFGLIAIGNRDPSYYRSSMGTLFLSYIGEVINRVLPAQIQAALDQQNVPKAVTQLPSSS